MQAAVARALREGADGIVCGSPAAAMAAVAAIEGRGVRLGQGVDIASKEAIAFLRLFRAGIVAVREDVALLFVPERNIAADEEVELGADDLDEIPYAGSIIDLGEAVAQSLALAIDPFATGPEADEARRRAGMLDAQASGPFAALAGLKKGLGQ